MIVLKFLLFLSSALAISSFRLHRPLLNRRSDYGLFMNVGPSNHFDYLVIGGGSGGMATARRAAGYGAKVGLIENKKLGGTCVNNGCVPKKVMFNAATIHEVLNDAKFYGFEIDNYKFNYKILKVQREKYLSRLNDIYGKILHNNNITTLNGQASFLDSKTVLVDGKPYTADNICIAVGGKPFTPNIEGVENCINSDGFFKLEELPKSIAVIGGGYIGVELAGVLNSLGVKTDIITNTDRFLHNFDEFISNALTNEFKKQGVNFRVNESPNKIVKDASTGLISVYTNSGHILGPYEKVLLATGRQPNIDGLNLEKANVKINKQNFIEVDDFQRTSSPGIHAVGDVCGKVQLTPMAVAAGRRLADR